MASIRQLKKEIEFLSSQMIGDCIDFVQTFDGKEMEAMAVIDEIVLLHNSTIDNTLQDAIKTINSKDKMVSVK